MNKVNLIGRLTRDPEVRYSQGENPTAVARYTLAVDRRFKREGEQTADFINCVAFGKNGEFAEKYLRKGVKIAVSGRIQTGSYEKEGTRIYTTDIVVEEHEFCESKGSDSSGTSNNASQPVDDAGFIDVSNAIDEELPFN
jgi:single-strand DNA-binding protein